MRLAKLTHLLLFGSAALVALACSSSEQSSFPTDDVDAIDSTTPPPSNGFGDGTSDGIAPPGATPACVSTSAVAELEPVNLIVLFDRSGSMGDTTESPSFDPNKRWLPVGQAMKSFFDDPASSGLNASLTFFPNAQNSCKANDYAAPNVGLAPLPDPLFAAQIDSSSPKGDTPTRAALAGAIVQAKDIALTHPNERTVILLVTDGEPYGCGADSDLAKIVADVSAVREKTPTYVIGVGPSVKELDAVAAAGGTTAFHVDVGNAAETAKQLVSALAQIRGALARCDFDIPPPPDGRTIDFDRVTVDLSGTSLPYAQDCANGVGWHYDDATAPKKVLLCESTCSAVKTSAGGKLTVSFECVDRQGIR